MVTLSGAAWAAWGTVKWLLSPVGRILSLVGVVLIAVMTVYAKGRREGRQAERARVREAVKRVEREMKVETDRTRSTEETRKRLEDGNF